MKSNIALKWSATHIATLISLCAAITLPSSTENPNYLHPYSQFLHFVCLITQPFFMRLDLTWVMVVPDVFGVPQMGTFLAETGDFLSK